MLAALVRDGGEIELGEIPNPVPKVGEALIQVKAVGVNRADLLQRRGKYPPPAGVSPILGLEVAGVVAEDRSGRWPVGAEVYTLLPGGGYAEYVTVNGGLLWEKPSEWDFEYAAAIPEGLVAAFLNLVLEGELALGERVFIEGGSSGVGTFAIQLAKLLGAHVIASAGSAERTERLLNLGADCAVNHHAGESPERESIDLILSIMGGGTLQRNIEILRPQGRIVVIAAQGGVKGEINCVELMRKRGRIIGSVLRSRSEDEKVQIKNRLDRMIGESVRSAKVKPVVDSVFPLAEVAAAHKRMELGEHFGKIVLTVGS